MRVLKTMAIVVLLGGLLSVPVKATAQTCSDVNSIQGFADFIVYKLQSGQRGQLLACLERTLMDSEQNFSNTLSYKGMPSIRPCARDNTGRGVERSRAF